MDSFCKKVIFLTFLVFLLIPFFTEAITIGPPFELPTFEELINAIINFISWVAIAIVPIAIFVAAFYFLTSGGDPEKVRTAKRIIFFTIIGLIIILLARGISGVIKQILVGPQPGPPSNLPPVARFTKSATIVKVGESINFNASASSDSDGTIVSYSWSFGDGTTGSGVTISHFWLAAGTYTVTLTAIDNDGASDSATSGITVNPPTYCVDAGGDCMLRSECLTIPPPGSHKCHADPFNCTVPQECCCFFNNPPTADARVGSAPGPTGTSVTVTEGATVYFDGSNSLDSDGGITKYEWDFENNGTYDATAVATTHVYSVGSYTAKLQVTDDDLATSTDTVSVTVNPAPVLTASITSPSNGQIFLQGASVTFTGSVTGGVAPYTYSWTSNRDGNIGSTITFTKNNLSVGNHTITFRVTDSAPVPKTASASITITVTNDVTPPTIQNAKVNPTSGPSGTIFTITADIADPLGLDPTTTIAHIQRPDETDVALVTLYDDGTHGDGVANDGTYGASWNSTGFPSGAYYVDITACDLIRNCGEKENI